jgi:hypothetical protein
MPALGFDPAPGDVASTTALARRYAEIAAEITAVQNQVTGIDLACWEGKAAAVARTRQAALARAFAKTAAAIERAGTERDAMAAFEPSSVQLAERAAPGIEWAGRALGGLGLLADAGTLITPQDTGAVGWVDRGAAAVNGGFLTADLLGADAVMDVIPGVGEVAIAATGLYLAGDFLYHHRAQLHDAADAAGHIIVKVADDTGHAAVRAADDVGQAESTAWDSTVGSLF